MSWIFLQIDSINNAVSAQPVAAEQVSLWGLLDKGGWIMYPLYAMLVGAIFVFFRKVYSYKKSKQN